MASASQDGLRDILRGLHHCRMDSCFDCPYRGTRGGKCRSELMSDAREAIINMREALNRGK